MSNIRLYKLRAIPVTFEPSALYFIKPTGQSYSDIYITDLQGQAFPVTNVSILDEILGAIPNSSIDPGDLTLAFDNGLV